ncbi:MAG TPA: hypothetical protein VM101_11300 [Flavitalea sp.]|nr:hypothetical protein [Flavitalea sp.]
MRGDNLLSKCTEFETIAKTHFNQKFLVKFALFYFRYPTDFITIITSIGKRSREFSNLKFNLKLYTIKEPQAIPYTGISLFIARKRHYSPLL